MTGRTWQDMFDSGRPGGGRSPAGVPPAREEPESDDLPLDLSEYKPWIVQRVRSRPSMMLDLRRFEPRSGMWMGWAMSYPSLHAAEYTGDRLLSLDFGTRQFMIEGNGLDALLGALQQGMVLAVQEYAAPIWPTRPTGPVVTAIRRLGAEGAGPQR